MQHDYRSTQNLIAWLEQQPFDRTYCYRATHVLDTSDKGCLLYQYFTAQGFDIEYVAGSSFLLKGKDFSIRMPPGFDEIALAEPHTFGAALARAKQHERA